MSIHSVVTQNIQEKRLIMMTEDLKVPNSLAADSDII